MGCKIDLTGHKYGMLTVLCEADPQILKSGRKNPVWRCMCDCGNEKNVRSSHLRSGATTSCGCYHSRLMSETRCFDLLGQRFGKLVVIAKERHKGMVKWRCRCDCGNEILIESTRLTASGQTSCKCNLRYKVARKEYERIHGVIPDGHKVIALDGDFKNLSPDNLYVTTNRHLQRIGRIGVPSTGSPDIKRIALDLCKLNDMIDNAEKEL